MAPLEFSKCAVTQWDQAWKSAFEQFVQRQISSSDKAHDLAHIERVAVNAQRLMRSERGDPLIILPAAWLHDCVVVNKDSGVRNQASRLAAQRASEFLRGLNYPPELIPQIAHAIEAHSFSAGIAPETREAKIVQDADRLDALGAIGIARCMLTAGAMGAELYHADEPIARQRDLDDRQFAIDHFFKKLLRLPQQMQTETGRQMAKQRTQFLIEFLKQIAEESGWRETDLNSELNSVF
jgi:uncharacterized protein